MENFFKITRKEVSKLLKKARFCSNNFFTVRKNNHDELKVVISVKKKFYKKAVKRNKIKRIIREIIRKDFNKKKGFYLIIIKARKEKELKYKILKNKLNELL
ncbi:MAG: ribonuclease P protein component [Candidatus Muiribacteriota bacterium]